ncbi:leucine--tRNA ligase [Firmicutes bacterium CAG:460]|nr:leucine--tRNA ligase [Firmicutes bacterium CAG:460]
MNHKEIEKKWQKYWEEKGCFKAITGGDKKPYYILVEFPYPSGNGLHVGHVRSYTAQDAIARMMRMQGYNVLYPMGWDAFGAPAEQYAIKNHIHPKEAVKENIQNFKRQMMDLGFSFDWNREFSTTDPEYYKWTQWQFLQFYKHGMAYKDTVPVNWCPTCKSVLSNEDAAGGVCERCGTQVVQKEKSQWMLRMSDYSEDLLEGLKDTNFAEKVKLGQINWIGKSIGANVNFKIKDTDKSFTVFTTRCDTLFGATYCVMAPEHELVSVITTDEQREDVNKYIDACKLKNDMERTELNKDKTGVFTGAYAINPVNGCEIPIWISDYVLASYGTGAIMAVPAHDTRDFEFATKFGLKIIPVLQGPTEELPYVGDGVHINSEFLNGLGKEEAISKMVKWLEENKCGEAQINYKMRDWIFSRQRFWGEPIPMVHCDACGWVPLNESDLPLVLPDVAEYEPTDDGESPLANITDWVNTTCPKCGGPARRETDTMPNWAGSSWYFLRFMDAHNDNEFASMDAMKYWNRVDWYNGGMEHTARHLLYARFWVQFLYNIGLVPHKEMIWTRVSHGMVLGSNNEKMSKSKGNVINPDDIVNEYGADTLRVYEMFMGDYEQDAPWSTDSLKGCKRFLDRIVRLKDRVASGDEYSKNLETIIHQSIKKVTYDLSHIAYNTAVSTLMILLNKYEECEHITKKDYTLLLTLLNPMAPHITEELNESFGQKPICEGTWPEYDEAKTILNEKEIGVQVNGKLRGSIVVSIDDSEDVIKDKALNNDNVKRHIEGLEIVKVIVIKGRIVNIVVK